MQTKVKIKIYSDYKEAIDSKGNLNELDSIILTDSKNHLFDEIKSLVPVEKLEEAKNYLAKCSTYIDSLEAANIPENLVGEKGEEQFVKEHTSPETFKYYKEAIDFMANTKDWEIIVDVKENTDEETKNKKEAQRLDALIKSFAQKLQTELVSRLGDSAKVYGARFSKDTLQENDDGYLVESISVDWDNSKVSKFLNLPVDSSEYDEKVDSLIVKAVEKAGGKVDPDSEAYGVFKLSPDFILEVHPYKQG